MGKTGKNADDSDGTPSRDPTARERWDDRYEDGDPPTKPVPLVEEFAPKVAGSRALDVATGGGRNALFLAECGFDVDAIDISDVGLEILANRSDERNLDVTCIRANIESYAFPVNTYDLITVTHFHSLNALSKLTRALRPGGVLLYEQNVQRPGGEYDRFRFYPNDLLRGASSLRIVRYQEPLTLSDDGDTAVQLVAERSTFLE